MSLSIAISSAKGGTGVSTLARNMAVFLAQVGKSTALVDLSGSLSNIEAFSRLEDHEVVSDGPAYLKVKPGLPNLEVYLARGEKEGLWEQLRGRLERSEIEALVMDLRFDGSAFASRVLRSCPLRVLVTRPEPTSVWELYACASRLVQDALEEKLDGDLQAVHAVSSSDDWLAGFLSPHDIMDIAGTGPVRDAVLETLRRMRIGFLVNMAVEREDFELGRAIESVGTRLFSLPLQDLGIVERDDAIGAALRSRVPLLVHMAYSKGGRDLEGLVRRLLSTPAVDHLRPRIEIRTPDDPGNLYEALEVDRGAGEHEIRKATKRVRDVFSGLTHATVEIRRPEALVRILERVEDAHLTLLDRRLKREYDTDLIREEGVSSLLARPWDERPPAPDPSRSFPSRGAPPEPVPEDGVTGAWLASVREKRSITLDEMSDISKVSVTYIRAIEEEAFAALPATVYVRGFLTAYSRTLGLDADAVVRSYLALIDASG